MCDCRISESSVKLLLTDYVDLWRKRKLTWTGGSGIKEEKERGGCSLAPLQHCMNYLQYTIYELLWLFLIYSLLGWCAGVVVAAVKQKKFVNTGVLNLPLCPVYGFSTVAYSIFLVELKEEPVFLFLGGAILSAFLVVGTGVVLEHIFHRKWRDYSEYRFGFGGFINAQLLIVFGVSALLVLKFGNPLLLKLVHMIPKGIGRVTLAILLTLATVDLSGVLAVVWKWKRYVDRLAALTENMQHVSATFGNAITRHIRSRLEKSYPNIETEKILETKAAEEPKDKTVFAQGCGFYKMAWLFFLGALLGDLVETVFCRITMGYWMSRSSLVYGPFSIVWGFACALLTAFLYRYRHRSDRFIFIYGTVVGGAYEYICSVLSEMIFGTIFWDYSGIPFNLGGRINLLYCFFWGIAAVLWLKGVYPFLSKWIEKIPKKIGPAVTWLMAVLMVINMGISALAMGRYSERQSGVEAKTELAIVLDEHFPDERMEKVYPKAKFVN